MRFLSATLLLLAAAFISRADDAEMAAVQAIEKHRGLVFRDTTKPGKPVVKISLDMSDTMTDAAVKELVPFKNLIELSLSFTKVTDAGLRDLAPLTNLSSLNLEGTDITDDGLKELAPLTNLTSLELGITKVTDAGLKVLVQHPNLTKLSLGSQGWFKLTDQEVAALQKAKVPETVLAKLNPLKDKALLREDFAVEIGQVLTNDERASYQDLILNHAGNLKITDLGLKDLAKLKNLTSLDLDGTSITDAGLKDLATLKNLMILNLFETNVTDEGVKHLTALKNLTSLDLWDTKVTDMGVKELAQLTSLTKLNLSGTKVTDASIKELALLTKLSLLDLTRTQVTEAGVNQLRKLLPKCEILR